MMQQAFTHHLRPPLISDILVLFYIFEMVILGFAMTRCDWLHAPHSISR
jgi:hypothetical protein